jgi:hypothetical protein
MMIDFDKYILYSITQDNILLSVEIFINAFCNKIINRII